MPSLILCTHFDTLVQSSLPRSIAHVSRSIPLDRSSGWAYHPLASAATTLCAARPVVSPAPPPPPSPTAAAAAEGGGCVGLVGVLLRGVESCSALLALLITPHFGYGALVTTATGFASSHHLDYAAHLVSGPARSPSSWGAPVFPLEVLEDRQLELGFLAAAVPHLCALLLAPEGDPDAFIILIPRTHAKAVAGPWASYSIAAEEAEMASYRSTGTYVDVVPPPGTNVISGMWLYKLSTTTTYTVWQLRRSVYGLCQAPREWHDTLRTNLAALDFFPSSADPSLFVRRGSTPFFVIVFVDNLVFATPNRRALASVKEELQRRHTCTDLGELQCYLGLQITRDRATRTNSVTQLHMVEQILTRFRFSFSKVQLTPLAVDHGLTAPPLDEQLSPAVHILSCVLARFVAPGRHRPSHWYAAKRVAKYVASTSGMGLVLGGQQPVTLTGFSELSWADNAESLRSTQGYCFSLGTGAPSCRSTRASSVSSSSCEAEVYAAAMAAQELRWLSFPLVLFADNRSAVLLREEPRLVGKAK
ncbi:unnamed protein product [Closterium sp. NIES-53]